MGGAETVTAKGGAAARLALLVQGLAPWLGGCFLLAHVNGRLLTRARITPLVPSYPRSPIGKDVAVMSEANPVFDGQLSATGVRAFGLAHSSSPSCCSWGLIRLASR